MQTTANNGNGELVYYALDGDLANYQYFSIGNTSGNISIAKVIDRELLVS